jgi:hypothetical protein
VDRLRRKLVEIWIIVPLSGVIGFLGPFGTYVLGDFFQRATRWWVMLMVAYLLVRPTMVFWYWIAKATRLPQMPVIFWGLVASSFPMAYAWERVGAREISALQGFSGFFPFALLCCFTIHLVAWMAARVDDRLMRNYTAQMDRQRSAQSPVPVIGGMRPTTAIGHLAAQPRLRNRLGPAFGGVILALESEDHYVRVHGTMGSDLVLMRLRDAIAEMDDVRGEQTHRSWWVARDAVAGVNRTGRNIDIILADGTQVPVARDSVDRLERIGFLPGRDAARA